MPQDPFAAYRRPVAADVASDTAAADPFAAYRRQNNPDLLPTRPVSAEDFMKPEDIANRDNGTPLSLDVLKGFGKRAASSVADVGEMAAASLNVPGVRADLFNPVLRHPIFQRVSEDTKATNKAQELGGNLELAAELAGPAVSVAKAVPALAKGAVSAAKALPSAVRVGGPVLVDLATGNYLKAGRRLLGAALEGGKFAEELPKVAEELKAPPVMTGTATAPPQVIGAPGGFSMPVGPPPRAVPPPPGRVVAPPARIAAEDQIAAALAESGPPAMPPVELPPQAALPPGYTPRSTVPASARPAAARPPAAPPAPAAAIPDEVPAPSLAEQLQASLEAQAGAAPRAPVPTADRVPKAVKARMAKARARPEPTGPPQRAYFLKSPEAIAAADEVPEAVAPSGSIDMADLPASWKAHTGQDLFPTTGAEAKAMRTALRAEIKDRGMTVGQAIAAVSKNKDIPTPLRAQMLRSLRGGA